MSKIYTSFNQIDKDLKKISLEQQIAVEELKLVKSDVESTLKPLSILSSVFTFVSKYGILLLIKKIFK